MKCLRRLCNRAVALELISGKLFLKSFLNISIICFFSFPGQPATTAGQDTSGGQPSGFQEEGDDDLYN